MLNKFGRRFEEFLLLGRKLFPELPWTDSNDGKILSNVVVQTFHDAVLFFFASLVEFARQFLKLGLVVSISSSDFLRVVIASAIPAMRNVAPRSVATGKVRL